MVDFISWDFPSMEVLALSVFGSALVAWGVVRTKVGVLEHRMDNKVTKDTFEASLKGIDSKLDIMLKGLDRVHERMDEHLSEHHRGKL